MSIDDIAIIIAILGLFLTILQIVRLWLDYKIKDLKMYYSLLSGGRYIYSELMWKVYKRLNEGEFKDNTFLLVRDEWSFGKLVPLQSINVKCSKENIKKGKNVAMSTVNRKTMVLFSLPNYILGYGECLRRYAGIRAFNG